MGKASIAPVNIDPSSASVFSTESRALERVSCEKKGVQRQMFEE